MATTKTEWYDLEELLGGSNARLNDLAEYLQLGAKCRECRHTVPMNRHDLAARYGKHEVIVSLKPKLICTACGQKRCVFVVAKIDRNF